MRVDKYDIILDVDSKNHLFKGFERILMNGKNEQIVLNAADLKIISLKINDTGASFEINEKEQALIVNHILKNKAEVTIEYSGNVSDSLMGLYRARTDGDEVLTTQFAPSDARRVFPGIDDPSHKAEFSLTLKIDRGLDAISNMLVRSEREEDGKKVIEFEPTPRMSTYLLYIGIGNFDHMKGDYGGKDIILSAAKGHLSETDYPVKIARDSLSFYEKYFGIEYALPKLHLISVPEFALGAMENWGAITFREILLTIARNSGARTLKSSAEVIAHEIAHQWFGNLVTMKWWNDLWLNESFATFMASKVVDEINPEWDVWGDFLLSQTKRAMWGDSLKGSHPIDVEVKDTSEIAQIFDEISYGKGGSILRMIESYVGKENFRDGIRKYLNDHSYGNATGSDLWESIEAISKQPVTKIMGVWITKQGFPVVYATKEGNHIRLKQEQFYLSGKTGTEIWPIPLTVVRSGNVERLLMDSASTEIGSDGFIKLNFNQTGFYRTLYDKALFEEMISHIDLISNLERWGIVNDLYSFLLSGKLKLSEYLDRIESFSGEKDFIVVEEISSQLLELSLAVQENSRLSSFASKFLKEQIVRLGEFRKGEHPNISILRGSLSQRLAIIDRNYASELSKRFESYDQENPDLKGAIAIAYAISKNNFNGIAERLFAAKTDEEKVRLILAMGWLQDQDELQKVINIIKERKVKKQDTSRFYLSASINPASKEFMLENLSFAVNELYESFAGMGMTGRVVEGVIPGLATHDHERLMKLLGSIKINEIERGKNKGIEIADILIEFRRRSLSER